MNLTRIAIAAVVATAFTAGSASAQSPVRFSVVGGFSLPEGDLGNGTDLGVSLGLRGEGRALSPGWTMRGDLSWDRYDGRGAVDAYSYLALAGNLVHYERGGRLYEFGGVGVYNSRVAFANTLDRTGTNLGVQVGMGVNLSQRAPNVFAEFGVTSVFTTGRSSAWFPVRLGVRF